MRALIIISLFLFTVSCRSTSNMSAFDKLTAGKWTLSDIPGTGSWNELFTEITPFMEFDNGGGLHGSTGCNNFHGNFSLTENGIEIDPGAMTRKMCPGDGEQVFINALKQVNAFDIDEGVLTLLAGKEPMLKFQK